MLLATNALTTFSNLNHLIRKAINFFKYLSPSIRLSQSRSLGFLVWCGRTRHELSLARASRSQSRYALKSSTCGQVYQPHRIPPKTVCESTFFKITSSNDVDCLCGFVIVVRFIFIYAAVHDAYTRPVFSDVSELLFQVRFRGNGTQFWASWKPRI